MTEPMTESMADVRGHFSDVLDRAYRDHTPTIVTRRGRPEAVVVDYRRYQELVALEEASEEAWLNRLADAAEAEGREPALSLEEMAARLLEGDGSR